MQESDSINIFSSYSDEKLRTTLDELSTMDSTAIISLKQEFMNREMFEESFAIDTFFSDQFDPSKLSLKEIQKLVSDRLQTGESIESIKSDLADHGITLAELIENEGKRIDEVFEKIVFAPSLGINKEIINEELKKEYDYTDEELVQVKKNLKRRSISYKIVGVFLVLYAVVHFSFALWQAKPIAMLIAISFGIGGFGAYSNGVRLSRK